MMLVIEMLKNQSEAIITIILVLLAAEHGLCNHDMTVISSSGEIPVSDPDGFMASPKLFNIAPSTGQILAHCASA